MLKSFVKGVIASYGYDLKVRERPLRGYAGFLSLCRQWGIDVNTVLDAGVGYGTPWLYDAFPDAQIVLFEPLEKFAPVLRELEDQRGAKSHAVALGSSRDTLTINVVDDHTTGSSLKRHSDTFLSSLQKRGIERTSTPQQVQVVPLDDLTSAYDGPFLLKLDVEGFELEALRGAAKTLERTEMIIAELSLLDRYEDGANFLGVSNFLDEAGFALFEIITMGVARPTDPVAFVDAVYVPKTSLLRT